MPGFFVSTHFKCLNCKEITMSNWWDEWAKAIAKQLAQEWLRYEEQRQKSAAADGGKKPGGGGSGPGAGKPRQKRKRKSETDPESDGL